MKKLFYLGILGIGIYELLKVYLIMPFPGSQVWDTIDLAYFLHRWRNLIRCVLWLMILSGSFFAFRKTPIWIPAASLTLVMALTYVLNYRMAADALFQQPGALSFLDQKSFTGNDSTLVIALEYEGKAKAYPIRYLVYHHQVRDTLGKNHVMVTYCSVCRTGRVFSPILDGSVNDFRLVGMDHFNAMFEDSKTGSWWQQATGEAIAGELKGKKLDEIESLQMTVGAFFRAYPNGKIMAEDPNFSSKYDSLGKYEKGQSESELTGTDPFSWGEKSWVIGVDLDHGAKAYDWNKLKEKGSIRDRVGKQDILLLLSRDTQSFVVFEIPQEVQSHLWAGDTLHLDSAVYLFTGKSLNPNQSDLKRLKAYQEFWHSWRSFRPGSLMDSASN